MKGIEHVSDTALMVAACRAMENDREDGLVRDPFAAALAGEKGMAIARSASAIQLMSFGVGARIRFIDDLVTRVMGEGVRTVLNLGAGLDTRPWRMDLPPDLRWIEVDFQPMLDYKSERLEGQKPRCALEQMAADLSVLEDRKRVFAAVGADPALMITEGLLMYLPGETVAALASEPPVHCGVRRWIFDASSLHLMRAAHGDMLNAIESVRAPDHLEGRDIVNTALQNGWRTVVFRSYAHDAAPLAMDRVKKMIESAGVPPQPPPVGDMSGVYLLER